jgi:hypothetical protein
MAPFNLDDIRQQLLSRLPPLFPKNLWREDLTSAIEKSQAPDLVRAGLHLWNDNLTLSHEIAQTSETPYANYWHAIVHRREGDFGNSLYWYARAEVPVLGKQMETIYPDWNPKDFVRSCEEARSGSPQEIRTLEELQAKEMTLLLHVVLAEES